MANNSFVFGISAAREEVALSTLTIFCLSTTLFAGKTYRLMNTPEQSSWINKILCDVMLESCSVQYGGLFYVIFGRNCYFEVNLFPDDRSVSDNQTIRMNNLHTTETDRTGQGEKRYDFRKYWF